jgi:hypothetical protein
MATSAAPPMRAAIRAEREGEFMRFLHRMRRTRPRRGP